MKINECDCGCGGTEMSCKANSTKGELENYMFVGNLQIIKRAVDMLLQMDPSEVDAILQDGHNWAADHIATSKDDIEEVAGFLINRMQGGHHEEETLPVMGMKKHFVHTFESFSIGHKLKQGLRDLSGIGNKNDNATLKQIHSLIAKGMVDNVRRQPNGITAWVNNKALIVDLEMPEIIYAGRTLEVSNLESKILDLYSELLDFN